MLLVLLSMAFSLTTNAATLCGSVSCAYVGSYSRLENDCTSSVNKVIGSLQNVNHATTTFSSISGTTITAYVSITNAGAL